MVDNRENNNLTSRRRGTGFTNINRILEANKQNRLGSTIASGISGQAKGVKSDIGEKYEAFKTDAEKERLDTEENRKARENVLGRFKSTSGADDFSTSGEEESQFADFRSGQFKGPKEISRTDVTTARGKAQEAESLGRLTKSAGGREALLKRYVGGPRYTRGQKTLDNLLLGFTGGDQLGEARRETVGLERDVLGKRDVSQDIGKYYSEQAKQFGAETQQALSGLTGETETGIQQSYDERVAGAKDQASKLQELLSQDKQLDAETAASLGMTEDQANELNRLIGMSGSEYIDKFGVSLYKDPDVSGINIDPQKQQDLRDYIANPNHFGMTKYDRPKPAGSVQEAESLLKQYKAVEDIRAGRTWDPEAFYTGNYDKILPELNTSYASSSLDPKQFGDIYGANLNPDDIQAHSLMDREQAEKYGFTGGRIHDVTRGQREDFDFASNQFFNPFREEMVSNPLEAAKREEVLKLNALKRLSGEQEALAEDRIGAQKIQNIYDAEKAIEKSRTALDTDRTEFDEGFKPLEFGRSKVICTELYSQGLMSEEIYRLDQAYGEYLLLNDTDVVRGYHFWAIPFVKLMKKSKLVTRLVTPIAMKWANEIAGKENVIGKVLLNVGKPICRCLGKVIKLFTNNEGLTW